MQRRTRKIAICTAFAAVSLAAWTGAAAVAGAAETRDAQLLALGEAAAAAIAANAADHDDPADHTWNAADVAPITLNGSSASSSSADVSITGGTVTITGAGTYQLTGTLNNGQIVVNTTESGIVRLILNGVTISSATSSAINIVDAGEAQVVLNAGTTNRLTDAATRASTDESTAALFSDADLTIAGTGSLTVTGTGFDGITSKDGLVIASGTITVDAADEGIRGKDYVVVNGGTATVTADGDGIKSDEDEDATLGYVTFAAGAVTVTAAGDGVDGHTDVIVTGGTLNVRAGGGRTVPLPADASAKGLKAGVLIVTGGGQLTVDAADDALNSDVAVTIDGGTLNLATADDAVHGETKLDVLNGTVNVTNSYEGLEAMQLTISGGSVDVTSTDDGLNSAEEGLNEFQVAPNAYIRITGGSVAASGGTDAVDTNGTLTISGGTLYAHGSDTRSIGEGGLDSNAQVVFSGGTTLATGLAAITGQVNNSSTQRWITYNLGSRRTAGTVVQIVSGGATIAAFRPSKAFQQFAFSSPQIIGGRSYDVYTGGSVAGAAVGGLYPGGNLSGATRVGAATATTGPVGNPPPPPPNPNPPPPPNPNPPPPPNPNPPPPPNPNPPPPPTTSACRVTYAIISQWPGGFQADVQITNTGTSPINGWTARWSFANGQQISQIWGGSHSQSGAQVTVTNAAYNGSIAPNAAASFGFIGSWTGTNSAPTAFTVNNSACAAG
jgi:hypothetical protein